MKGLIYILLIGGMLTQVCSKTLVWVYHQVNQTELTGRYCINITRPERQCHGTCYLKKQLKAVENTERYNHNLAVEKQDFSLFCQQTIAVTFGFKPAITVLQSQYLCPVLQSPVFPVFHPPA